MAKRIIVADTSPLIAFGRIDHLPILKKTLGEIIAPRAVIDECLIEPHRPGSLEIQKAINKKIISIHPNPKSHGHDDLFTLLDTGEANAIILATKLQAGLLIDEKLGRNAARKFNLSVIGTAGVLVLAKRKKIIKNVKPILHLLKQSGYYLSSQLISDVLKLSNEN